MCHNRLFDGALVSAMLAGVGLSVSAPVFADIINVPADQPTIQAGIDAAADGDEVVVADGTYTGDGNTDLDFMGKAITVRSANGPESCIIDCNGSFEDPRRAASFHSGETRASVFDGFTITGGLVAETGGGAILVDDASPTVANCLLLENEVYGGSGAAVAVITGAPLFSDCVFHRNYAENSDNERGQWGGGLFTSGTPTVLRCRFTENAAWSWIQISLADGGAAYCDGGYAEFIECVFEANGAEDDGGAVHGGPMSLLGCTFVGNNARTGAGVDCRAESLIVDCTFSGNDASSRGGGVHVYETSGLLINCVFAGNCSKSGGGAIEVISADLTAINCTLSANSSEIDAGGVNTYDDDAYAKLSNCILWGNEPYQVNDASVTYSVVEGGWRGAGNIDADPLFVDPDNGDYRLSPGSPCIDAADNEAVPKGITTDLDGDSRFVDDPDTKDTGNGVAPIVDMGAYEFQVVSCPWDLDGDNNVGAGDLIVLLGSWGDPYGTADLIELLGNWGPCPK